MKSIVSFSTRHPVSVLMMVLSVVLFGVVSFRYIPVDFLPLLSVRSLLVSTRYEGIPAKEMREMVTIPLEDSIASLKGLKSIQSVSRDGLSLVKVELQWGIDADMAFIECREIVDLAFEKLPSQCEKPTVTKDDFSKRDTVTIVVRPKDGDLLYARHVVDDDIKGRFQRIDGVGAVNVLGGEKERIEVRVNRDLMESRKLTMDGISGKLGEANYEYPAGTIKDGENDLLVKTSALFTSLDEIERTPIAYGSGGAVTVRDIAEVKRGLQEKKTFFIYDGKECVKVGIQKREDASPVDLSRRVAEEVKTLNRMYGRYYDFIVIDDAADSVRSSLVNLVVSALVGVAVTVLIIQLVFRSWRIAGLLASIIPISTCAAVFVLELFGRSLNVMSLSGIAVGIGMVVDCGSVTLENLQKLRAEGKIASPADIDAGVAEVSLSNVGSTLTTVIVFFPVLFMKGVIGELFSDMAIAIISSISFSCLLSMTYIPGMYALLGVGSAKARASSRTMDRLSAQYGSTLKKVFERKWYALAIMGACLVIGIAAVFGIKYEFLPSLASDRLVAEIEFKDGTSIEYMEKIASAVYARLGKVDGVGNLCVSGGLEDDDYGALAEPEAKREKIVISCAVDPSRLSMPEAERLVRSSVDGDRFTVRIVGKHDLLADVVNLRSGSLVVRSDTPESSRALARKLCENGASFVPDSVVAEYVFSPDRVANSRYGVSALYTASVARNSLEGIQSAPYYENGVEIPLTVLLEGGSVDRVETLSGVGVQNQNGVILPLRALGVIKTESSEKVLYRFERKDARIVVGVSVTPELASSVIDLGKRQTDEMLGDATLLLIGVVVLLYIAMTAQFESFLMPLVLLVALPPAFSGAFLFLAVFGKTLNVNGIIALVTLFGTSVNNSIILYERCAMNDRVNAGTVTRSCAEKLRAILVTTGTNIGALIPFAIDPLGKSQQSSLSIAIIGGMIVSTVIVLYVIPVAFVYTLRGKGGGDDAAA
jgi:multidrug efflux pump subunit AcrB